MCLESLLFKIPTHKDGVAHWFQRGKVGGIVAQAVRDILNGSGDRLTGFDGLEQWGTRLCSSGEEGACYNDYGNQRNKWFQRDK